MGPDALERRYRERSLWLDGVQAPLTPRPGLAGDAVCDVAIVGAGLTGLWTAYFLKTAAAELDVAVVEREIAGFGASGRNGGTVGGGLSGDLRIYARRHGRDAVREAERLSYRTVDELGRRLERERIACGWQQGGWQRVATSEAQRWRLQRMVQDRRDWGVGPADFRLLEPREVADQVPVTGAIAAAVVPRAARVDPARLVRGVASTVERLGVKIYERTPALTITPGCVTTGSGRLSAGSVIRATEAFTVQLPGEQRRFLPLYSLMIATEPLDQAVWDRIGWNGGQTIGDLAHLFFYAQRTTDDRLAVGGRGAPYMLGSPICERYERRADVYRRLVETIRRHFPDAAHAKITHHWGCPLAVPRDWCQSVQYDRRTRMGWGGGYSGSGVLNSYLTGQVLAELVLERDTPLTRMPWVGHESPRWEPEPMRFLASRSIIRMMASSDRAERGRSRTARRMGLIDRFVRGHG